MLDCFCLICTINTLPANFNQQFLKSFYSFIFFFMMFLIFAALYKFMPVVKIHKRSVAIGAMWASIFWVAAKILFDFLSRFTTQQNLRCLCIRNFGCLLDYTQPAVFILGAEIPSCLMKG